MYEALLILPMFPAYYVFNSLLCALQILHIVWTWMIVKIALRAMSSKNPGVCLMVVFVSSTTFTL